MRPKATSKKSKAAVTKTRPKIAPKNVLSAGSKRKRRASDLDSDESGDDGTTAEEEPKVVPIQKKSRQTIPHVEEDDHSSDVEVLVDEKPEENDSEEVNISYDA
jgi:hypothetical protein